MQMYPRYSGTDDNRKTYASTIISSVRLEDLAVYRSCPVSDKKT